MSGNVPKGFGSPHARSGTVRSRLSRSENASGHQWCTGTDIFSRLKRKWKIYFYRLRKLKAQWYLGSFASYERYYCYADVYIIRSRISGKVDPARNMDLYIHTYGDIMFTDHSDRVRYLWANIDSFCDIIYRLVVSAVWPTVYPRWYAWIGSDIRYLSLSESR